MLYFVSEGSAGSGWRGAAMGEAEMMRVGGRGARGHLGNVVRFAKRVANDVGPHVGGPQGGAAVLTIVCLPRGVGAIIPNGSGSTS
jgi:hypothetical protein